MTTIHNEEEHINYLKSLDIKIKDSLIPSRQMSRYYLNGKTLTTPVITNQNEFYPLLTYTNIEGEDLEEIQTKIISYLMKLKLLVRNTQKKWKKGFAGERACLLYNNLNIGNAIHISHLVNSPIIPQALLIKLILNQNINLTLLNDEVNNSNKHLIN